MGFPLSNRDDAQRREGSERKREDDATASVSAQVWDAGMRPQTPTRRPLAVPASTLALAHTPSIPHGRYIQNKTYY